MTEVTKPEAAPKKATKKRENDEKIFSMNFWEDEKLARKHIKENLKFIAQKANDAGLKTHFSRDKDNGDGTQTVEVEFAQEVKDPKTGNSRIVFEGKDFIRVTYDPTRKFPKSMKSDDDEEGASKKKKEAKVFVKRMYF